MTYSAGDRFKYQGSRNYTIDSFYKGIWEIQELEDVDEDGSQYYKSKNIHNGHSDSLLFISKEWQYIGNFNKSSNFTNLWDILNG